MILPTLNRLGSVCDPSPGHQRRYDDNRRDRGDIILSQR